jgi:hypothetical protein
MRFVIIAIFILFFSCKRDTTVLIPPTIIQPDSMVVVLADFHLAQAATLFKPEADSLYYSQRGLKDVLLKKYLLTEAVFDSSLKFYALHPEIFQQIYIKVNEKLSRDQAANISKQSP